MRRIRPLRFLSQSSDYSEQSAGSQCAATALEQVSSPFWTKREQPSSPHLQGGNDIKLEWDKMFPFVLLTVSGSVTHLCPSFWWTRGCRPPSRLLCPWDSPGKEYWSGWPFSSLGALPSPGIEPAFLVSPALAGGFLNTSHAILSLFTPL